MANYTLQVIGCIPIVVDSFIKSNSTLKPILTSLGIQIISYIFLRSGEKSAEFGTNKSQKYAMLLPIYLQISLVQLTPYFDGGLLLQSSNSVTFVKLFLIHQISDFLKNSGLGSYAWFVCKSIAGLIQ